MAEHVPLTKEEIASKLVQEIAKRGDEIPQEYIHKDGFPVAIAALELWRGELLIDFSLLSSFSASELTKLRSALTNWGCFQVIYHGIENSFLEELIETSKQFFALPLDEKLKYSAEDDIVQGLFLFLYPPERLRLKCWPLKPEKFREMIEEYSKKITAVNKVLRKAMSVSLGLEEDCLEFGKHGPAIARFNLYPRCPIPGSILGTKPHAVHVMITYLLPGVEGLQVLKDDQWYC